MAAVMCESVRKRARLDNSDDLSDSSSCASEELWRGYETAWVKDSGDDWSPSSSSSGEEHDSGDGDATNIIYEVEYEIATDSSTENEEASDTEGSSDVDAVVMPIIAAALEDECLAGSESSDDGIIRSSPVHALKEPVDRWKCLRCGVLNVPPMRYCTKCYEIRKGWLDPRPRRKRARRTRQGANQSIDSLLETVQSTSSSISSTNSSQPIPSTSSSQCTDSGVGSSQSSSEELVPPGRACPCSTELCDLCGVRPITGSFMHGSTGHMVYCFTCSKRIWREKKKCPVCRRTISRVSKIFRVSN